MINFAAFQLLIERNEARTDGTFNMGEVFHPCGSPSCLIGGYIHNDKLLKPQLNIGRNLIGWIAELQRHFRISYSEAAELFHSDGCNNAKTLPDALAYVRAFVARKLAEAEPAARSDDASLRQSITKLPELVEV